MEKHSSIVKGRKERTIYELRRVYGGFGYGGITVVDCKGVFIEDVYLWEGELNLPLLCEGDTLLIEQLNLEVVIKRRLLSTTGEYIYETDYVDLIEDELTAESKIIAKEKLQEHEQQLEEFRKKQDEYVPEYDSSFKVNCRTWFQKWFGN